MSKAAEHEFSHLPAGDARLGAAFARPKVIAVLCIVLLAVLGWAYIALLVAHMSDGLAALCRPTFGLAMADGAWGFGALIVVFPMWAAMVLAMMLPSAGPMILTYAGIAETAARKGERIVSPSVIAAGYGLVWLGFALAATLAQLLLTRAAVLDASMASANALFSGAVFIAAGLYQFSSLKHACLTQCRQPFPFFFAHWETSVRGVFRLGVKQGLFCLGCCWAMMAVMFAVGAMNVVWMAGLGIIMTLEKIGTGKRLTYGLGAALIAAGAAFILTAFAAHWPMRAI